MKDDKTKVEMTEVLVHKRRRDAPARGGDREEEDVERAVGGGHQGEAAGQYDDDALTGRWWTRARRSRSRARASARALEM